jgi:hypothetical protein
VFSSFWRRISSVLILLALILIIDSRLCTILRCFPEEASRSSQMNESGNGKKKRGMHIPARGESGRSIAHGVQTTIKN